MRSPILLIYLLFLLLLWNPLWGEAEVDFGGSSDILIASGIRDSARLTACRTRLNPKLEGYAGEIYFKADFKGVYNELIPSETGLDFNEVFMEFAGENFDIRGGRQILSWGKADGIQITDIICPKNKTEFIALDYEDSRLPVTALKARVFGLSYTLETLWIPLFVPSAYPVDPENPLTELYFPSTLDTGSGEMSVNYEIQAGNAFPSLDESEFGVRLSLFLPALDLSLSCFSGWNDDPEYQLEMDETGTILLDPEYYRIWMYGVDAAIPVGTFIIRTEGAWTTGCRFLRKDPGEHWLAKDHLQVLAGLDWNPWGGWTLTTQYAEDILMDYEKTVNREERNRQATISISKNLLQETLQLSWFFMAGLNEFDSCHSVNAEYAVRDDLKIAMGSDLYFPGSDREGNFGQLKDLSSLWVKGVFSF